ncbi:PAS domain-containing protein [Salinigranum marinum]|uniref:PAS domain-containing protein n=1 Tax=Salinigranum marinum TaxID=1515595 RepID=UPI002989DFDE|nr:PAS domain-containing protein [Salinigranum marinum]
MTPSGDRRPARVRSDALERVTDGVVAVDAGFRYTYVNSRAEEILGTNRQVLHGCKIWEAFPETTGTVAQQAITEAMATGRQTSFERYNAELEQWFDVQVYPDDSGLSIYFTDVTEQRDAARELERRNRQLTALVENTSDAIYIKDREGRYELMNEAAAALFGRDPESVVGVCDPALFDAESAAAIRGVDERIFATGETDTREAVRYIDGTRHVFDDEKHPYRDEDGRIVGVVGVSRDVTERTHRERELKRYRAFVENGSDAVTVVDADGTITYASPAIERITGRGPAEMVGTAALDHVHPDDRDRTAASLATSLVKPGATSSWEGRIRHADSSWVWAESTSVNRLDDDDVGGVIVIGRNVTSRRERERERHELAEEYEAVFENAGDAVFLVEVDSDGDGGEDAPTVEPTFRFVRLNPSQEAATGLATETVRRRTPRAVLGDELGAEVEANYRRCVEAGEPITYEEELALPGGTRTWQTRLAPVTVDGEVTRIVGIARDITRRVERERELQRKNDRLDEFASVVAHDLRNPLNVAQGRARLARIDGDAHYEPLVAALDRMETIIEDTLMLARQGDSISTTDPVAVAALVRQCWTTVETGEAALVVEDDVTVRGDRDRLRHVFENLFRNAVEHGSANGPQPADHVTVRVGRVGADGLYVEDDGPGVHPDRREWVFEPGHKSTAGGTGFGLTIVRRIAEAHDWTVVITDGSEGGARFEFGGIEFVD